MELIDREKLKSTIRAMVEIPNEVRANVLGAVSRAKAVDAVPVVRCKNCVYRHDSCFAGEGNTYCDRKHAYFPLDGFCSYGEKREV